MEFWHNTLKKLTSHLAPQNFEMWLSPIEYRGIDGETIKLRAPNPYVRIWFESHYKSAVIKELTPKLGPNLKIEFEPDQEEQPPESQPIETSSPIQESNASRSNASQANIPQAQIKPEKTNKIEFIDASSRTKLPQKPATGSNTNKDKNPFDDDPLIFSLNPRYNFETFVAGPSNQLAYAASQAAASTYPPKYNPVFVCGGVGLGKTHLLHAIGHHIMKIRPGSKLCYISGERFMNEYVQAIRTNQMHNFRKRYREGYDALLVDDIQFLAGKDGTQDEFFHTFNALHDSHRQIVLTADRKPHEISDIADRLRTRFAWGLLADIEPPELEVRVAILRKKADAEKIDLPEDVALYIATSIKSNVRELEGALIRLAAYASLSQRTINLDFARETLEGSITRPPEHISTDTVLKAVANYYNVKISDLKSTRRHKSIAAPRAVAMYLARTHTNESYPDLGRSFGGKHHTTVISAVEKIAKRLKEEPALRGEINAIESLILK